VHPSVRVDRLGGVDFIVKVSNKDVCAPHAKPGDQLRPKVLNERALSLHGG
jgi:hypothetical protein